MAASSWIDERKDYEGQRVGEKSRGGQIGHYTQVTISFFHSEVVANGR